MWQIPQNPKKHFHLPKWQKEESSAGDKQYSKLASFFYLQMQPTWKQHIWINLGKAWLQPF
jgi:hypothetical protein